MKNNPYRQGWLARRRASFTRSEQIILSLRCQNSHHMDRISRLDKKLWKTEEQNKFFFKMNVFLAISIIVLAIMYYSKS